MRLPPLNALRAFEAAARHGGYIAAGDELCVTRGAISRHVKILEAHLGCALFHRNASGVDLTAAGRRFLPVLSDAFRRIEAEARAISAGTTGLNVICPPASSIRWLMPRIARFRAAHPNIPLRLTTDFQGPAPFENSDHDLGLSVEIRPGRPPDIRVAPFMPYLVSPAAIPEIATRIAAPGDLANLPLLRESPFGKDWEAWIGHFGITGIRLAEAQVFANLDIAVQAALMGEGVVMVDPILCRAELDSGRLVLLFPDMVCPTEAGDFALIGPSRRWNDPDVTAFRNWVLAEGEREHARLADHLR